MVFPLHGPVAGPLADALDAMLSVPGLAAFYGGILVLSFKLVADASMVARSRTETR